MKRFQNIPWSQLAGFKYFEETQCIELILMKEKHEIPGG
jgi:hypothetical protein